MLEEGNKAPAFNLESDSGETVSLKSFAGKLVVLYFYPKDMTSGCTQQACDFRDAHSVLKRRGAVLLGVSKDSAMSHGKFRTKYDLPFPLLVDADGKVCHAYGVWVEKSMYGRKYFGIERTTFVVGPDGKIAKIFPKVKVAGHVAKVLEFVSSL